MDDEPRVLEGLENHLAMDYEAELATGGAEALELVRAGPPFAVVISDMRMPKMNGASFLTEVRACSPNTTRMLLTGQSDIGAAVAAINEGQIFRFLSKPCPPESLIRAVKDAVRQNQLMLSEKHLLQRTLKGSVQVLSDVMSLTTPAVFARVSYIRAYVVHMCQELELKDAWQYELAATLAQLGCMTLPADTLSRLLAGQPLDKLEQALVAEHPAVGQRLLSRIPRFESVAAMIGKQHKPLKWTAEGESEDPEAVVALGSNLLRVVLAFNEQMGAGKSTSEALELLRKSRRHSAPLLDALSSFEG